MMMRLSTAAGLAMMSFSAGGVNGALSPPLGAVVTGQAAVPAPGRVTLSIITQLGDQCPNVPVIPDPRCDPKPRPGTSFEVRTADGDLVTAGRTDASGHATVAVDEGNYLLSGEAVVGYQFTAERSVSAGAGATAIAVALTYSNGIQ